MRNLNHFVCLLLIAVLCQASATSAAPLKVLGMNDMSCATWKKQTDPELRADYIHWVRGFLSGHNYANQSKQVSEVSEGTVTTFIDRYCAEHAAASITDAAMHMSDLYSGRNAPIIR